jgi:phosphatidyl-myo-inositol dimannoside synthase
MASFWSKPAGPSFPVKAEEAPRLRKGGAAVLGTVTQESGHGGIARVSVLLWRAMETLAGNNRRMVTLLKDSRNPKPMDKLRFTARMAQFEWRGEAKWILFDHLGIAAVQSLVPRRWRAPYAIFLHSVEVWRDLPPRQNEALRSAAIRIANSHYSARRIDEMHPDAGPIEVCHLALPDEVQPAGTVDAEAIAKVGRASVLIVGRMASAERYKGHDQLIEVWQLVRRAVPDAQLIIAGTGDDVPRLEAAARQTGASEGIFFIGRVSDATLDALYAHAAVFAMPARAEGFGIVYLEAMRHRLPCVAGIHDAAREVVEHGKTGFLVDQGNREELAAVLIQLLQNPPLREQMGDAGLRRLKAFFTFHQFQTRLAGILAPFLTL